MKVRFNSNGDPKSFKETLEQMFPKLTSGRGFELLRHGLSGRNQLALIQPPPIGYSVEFLKSSDGIGQALLNVRPIQSNLDIETTGTDMDNEVKYFIIPQKYARMIFWSDPLVIYSIVYNGQLQKDLHSHLGGNFFCPEWWGEHLVKFVSNDIECIRIFGTTQYMFT
jgi:hypothetical protein